MSWRMNYPTAFSPPGGPLCPHKKKKKRITPRHFGRRGGAAAHTRKKNELPHGIFADGGGLMPTQEKEK